MVTAVQERIQLGAGTTALGFSRWHDGAVVPDGHRFLDSFRLEGLVPVWTYVTGPVRLEKRVFMARGANATIVEYRLLEGPAKLPISIDVHVAYRDHHATTRAAESSMEVALESGSLVVTAFLGARPLRISASALALHQAQTWHLRHLLSEERARGFTDDLDDDLHVATAAGVCSRGSSVSLILSAEPDREFDASTELDRIRANENELLSRARAASTVPLDEAAEHLVLAAGEFLVPRQVDGEDGATVLAGYPWFSDWGRDTMISLPGLTLTTGRPELARTILSTYSKFVSEGMIPNRFPDSGEQPEYNTVDATLWFIEAVRAYVASTGDLSLGSELWSVLVDIVRWHERGTRYGIAVDPRDGLLSWGAPGVQLTWMDAKCGDRVVTPRNGKCVEINALWYNALVAVSELAEALGREPEPFRQQADRVRQNFQRFWNEPASCLFDVVDGPSGDDPSIRPNQIFAVSLPASPLSAERQEEVVAVCRRELLTPFGLRSLSPGDPEYRGTYEGSPEARDSRYHQGTVWAWLLGPFALALYRVGHDAPAALKILEPLRNHLSSHGIGSISEIFDGDPPHLPRGCIAQAWSVAETLRAWRFLAGQVSKGQTSREMRS